MQLVTSASKWLRFYDGQGYHAQVEFLKQKWKGANVRADKQIHNFSVKTKLVRVTLL